MSVDDFIWWSVTKFCLIAVILMWAVLAGGVVVLILELIGE